jgi:hypothetical protein
MVPMIDTMLAPGTMDAVMSIGPAFVGVLIALVAGVAWLARETAEELGRTTARDRRRPHVIARPAAAPRLAA